VILCAGAVHSPAILQRSGIGPAALLSSLGIPPVRAISGVGENFQDHPGIRLSFQIKPSAQFADGNQRHTAVVGRYSSGVAGSGAADMQIISINFGVKHDAQNKTHPHYSNPHQQQQEEETDRGADAGEAAAADEARDSSKGFGMGGVVIWLNECFSTGQLRIRTLDCPRSAR